jgi:ATP-binding cassette subfamily B protein
VSKAVHPVTTSPDSPARSLRESLELFRFTRRALVLVWQTSPHLAIWLALASLAAGLLPAAITYVGKLIVDNVVHATSSTVALDHGATLHWIGIELGLVVLLAGVLRSIDACQSLLRALLGHRVNELILQKALSLELPDFEDSELYDRMTRARREASSRPLSLVRRAFGFLQNTIALTAFGALLLRLSPWVAAVLVVAAIPSFLSESRFSRDAFRLFRWRSPETRRQLYLETVLAREDTAKEVQLYGIGPLLLERYRNIFRELYQADRNLTLRRAAFGFALGLLSTAAFYGAYAWIGVRAIGRHISLGEMTMYLLLFKQGQSTLSAIFNALGGMYEDNLYLSTLYEYLEHKQTGADGTAERGPDPSAGIVFEAVRFRYPGATEDHAHQIVDSPVSPERGTNPARRARHRAVAWRGAAGALGGNFPGLRSLPIPSRRECRGR